MMNNSSKIGVALVGGYLLGRTKKAKMAIGLGMFLAGKKLSLDPKQLGSMITDSQLLGGLNEQVRKELLDTTKSAATTALTKRIGGFADSLHERTLHLDGGDDDGDRDSDRDRYRESRDTDDTDDWDEREERDDEPARDEDDRDLRDDRADEEDRDGPRDSEADDEPAPRAGQQATRSASGAAKKARSQASAPRQNASSTRTRAGGTAKKTASSARKTTSGTRKTATSAGKTATGTARKAGNRGGGHA